MKWSEPLPDQCPPNEAKDPSGSTFYRVSKGDPVEDSDFFSQRKLEPDKVFKENGSDNVLDECITRSVSLFKNIEDAKRILKLPKFKGSCVAEIVLTTKDGVVMKTFTKSHYSWWRTKHFSASSSKIIQI